MHSRQRGLVRLRREYPPEFGQQSTIGPFAISETHPLAHEKMTTCTNNLCPQPFNSARRHASVMRHADKPAEWFEVELGSEWQACREGFAPPTGIPMRLLRKQPRSREVRRQGAPRATRCSPTPKDPRRTFFVDLRWRIESNFT